MKKLIIENLDLMSQEEEDELIDSLKKQNIGFSIWRKSASESWRDDE